MVRCFPQDQRDKMSCAFIAAGRKRPNRTVMQGFADEFGYTLDQINEHFKYLIKKNKKAQVMGDNSSGNFRHYHLSTSHPSALQHSSCSPTPSSVGSFETPPPIHQIDAAQPSHPEDASPNAGFESEIDSKTEDDKIAARMMEQYICLPESP
ncbi:hypothetical protein RSOLAG22IIIB_12452 [Rhizoctonia solani]|uniref:Uncharacterized protein n=1 Tax=Rhizoctonia solani TaxID=456999 RepID=A0A0K6GEF8_9AGAM|nr:hypothetical protein RSOLAG22IIIB_12452 [Rhizoctonia solani]